MEPLRRSADLSAQVILSNPEACQKILENYSERKELTDKEKTVILKYFGGMLLLAVQNKLITSYLADCDQIFQKIAAWYERNPFVVPLVYDQGKKEQMVSRLLFERIRPEGISNQSFTLSNLQARAKPIVMPELTDLHVEILDEFFYVKKEKLKLSPHDPNYLTVHELKVKFPNL